MLTVKRLSFFLLFLGLAMALNTRPLAEQVEESGADSAIQIPQAEPDAPDSRLRTTPARPLIGTPQNAACSPLRPTRAVPGSQESFLQ